MALTQVTTERPDLVIKGDAVANPAVAAIGFAVTTSSHD
jgi:hypothetical protein